MKQQSVAMAGGFEHYGKRRAPRTPPASGIATRSTSTGSNGPRTAPSPACPPRSNMCMPVLKLRFGVVQVRYRGPDKNANRLFVTCAPINLFLVRKRLLGTTVV